uniref:Uncharacterized protein n=1 Tax=Arundo donax TaxID=35708 RepID=A0A0A9HGR8_ARUDO
MLYLIRQPPLLHILPSFLAVCEPVPKKGQERVKSRTQKCDAPLSRLIRNPSAGTRLVASRRGQRRRNCRL